MSISTYCAKIESLRDALVMVSHYVKDEDLIKYFVAGLPSECDAVVANIIGREDLSV